jgi:RNA polymerase-binding transcription factor DksA
MPPIAERVAAGHPAGPMHDIMIRHYNAAHEACARQDAVVQAMRDSTDRGPCDEADHAATCAQLDEQKALADALHRHLADLAAAVARCGDGTYGLCQWCRQYIPIERLAAFPAATHCVPCKQLAQQC